MSQVLQTQPRTASFVERLNIVNIIITIVLALGGGAVSVLIMQATTTTRLAAVEKDVSDNKLDSTKQLEDIRSKMITRSDFDFLLRALSDIRDDVKEIRAEQLRQARERR